MNIVCDKSLLSAAIDGVSRAVTLRSSIPALEGILLKADGFQLTLTGYDLEMAITTTIEANVREPGEIVLSAKLLGDMVRRLPVGEVTITTGDGGFVGTSSDELYERAFGFHDQGHKPCRMGVEVGNRSMVGMNMRMNELSGAVAVAQGRKLDGILDTLRAKKKELKDQLQGIDGLGFRKINDEKECATLLTLLFDTKELADKFCAAMGTAPIAKSGWHVYNNMEQILDKKTWTDNHPFHLSDRTYEKHMLPQTDDILDRAVNISIGVVDKGLGSGCGININSTEEEINATAKHIREVIAGL